MTVYRNRLLLLFGVKKDQQIKVDNYINIILQAFQFQEAFKNAEMESLENMKM